MHGASRIARTGGSRSHKRPPGRNKPRAKRIQRRQLSLSHSTQVRHRYATAKRNPRCFLLFTSQKERIQTKQLSLTADRLDTGAERKKENRQVKIGMGGWHAATTQGFSHWCVHWGGVITNTVQDRGARCRSSVVPLSSTVVAM